MQTFRVKFAIFLRATFYRTPLVAAYEVFCKDLSILGVRMLFMHTGRLWWWLQLINFLTAIAFWFVNISGDGNISGRWEPFDCFVIDELNQLKICREILKVPWLLLKNCSAEEVACINVILAFQSKRRPIWSITINETYGKCQKVTKIILQKQFQKCFMISDMLCGKRNCKI